MKELVQAAQLEQSRTSNQQKVLTDLLQASNVEVQNLVVEKKTVAELTQVYKGDKDRLKLLADQLDQLDEAIVTQRKRVRKWQDELEESLKTAPKRAYRKCMKAVDCDEPDAVIVPSNNDQQAPAGDGEEV